MRLPLRDRRVTRANALAPLPQTNPVFEPDFPIYFKIDKTCAWNKTSRRNSSTLPSD
jgi:hypothetical protein